jgi:hypothetical protein
MISLLYGAGTEHCFSNCGNPNSISPERALAYRKVFKLHKLVFFSCSRRSQLTELSVLLMLMFLLMMLKNSYRKCISISCISQGTSIDLE